ncbi:MAG: type III pantothenate kinase [Synergistaceae bacterium]|jgi:type III pantothenate kinase|nr:type III pantothenate kinase [Synergistaceae bacterium]
MLLVLDIGNTSTSIGVFPETGGKDDAALHANFMSSERTPDEAGLLLENLLASKGVPKDAVDGAILCCVVPSLEHVWCAAIEEYFSISPVVVSDKLNLGIQIDMDFPGEVGADRLANAVGAAEKYGCPVVAVDLGTAINIDVVSAKGAYIGGAIAPGLQTSVKTLFSRTAKLPQVVLDTPPRAIGRNTVHAIQSGIVFGYTGLVDELVRRILAELGAKAPVVATGGHAEVLASQSAIIGAVDRWLTLEGLRIIYGRNKTHPGRVG